MVEMRWTLPKIWAIVAVCIFIGSCNINDCGPCVEAKPFRSTSRNRPVAILLAFDTAGHSRKSKIDPVLLTDTSHSAESWEVPVRKGPVRTSNALTKLLRPLVENGELESIESDTRQTWQCKRDELINLLRVVLKRKEHALANKHGVIHGVLSAEETFDDPRPGSTIPDDLLELLRPLPTDDRAKVRRALQAIIEKISDADIPELKGALNDLIHGLRKTHHARPTNSDGISSLKEALEDLSNQGSNEDDDEGIFSNLNPSEARERILRCLKNIIRNVSHRGVDNLNEIVHREVRDSIKDLVNSSDDPRLLERLKPLTRKIERTILTTIRNILEKPLQDLSEDSQETVRNSIKALVDSVVELLTSQPKSACLHAAKSNNSSKIPSIVEKIFNDLLNERDDDDQPPTTHSPNQINNSNPPPPWGVEGKCLTCLRNIIRQATTNKSSPLDKIVNQFIQDLLKDLISSNELPKDIDQTNVTIQISQTILPGLNDILQLIAGNRSRELQQRLKDIAKDLLKDILEVARPSPQDDSSAQADSSEMDVSAESLVTIIPNVTEKNVDVELDQSLETAQPTSTIHRHVPHIFDNILVEGVRKILNKASTDGPLSQHTLETVTYNTIRHILTSGNVEELPLPRVVVDAVVQSVLRALRRIAQSAQNTSSNELENTIRNIMNELHRDVVRCLNGHVDDSDQDPMTTLFDVIWKNLGQEVRSKVDRILAKIQNDNDHSNDSDGKPKPAASKSSLAGILKAVKPFRDVARDILDALKDIVEMAERDAADDLDDLAKHTITALCKQILFPDEHVVSDELRELAEPFVQHLNRKLMNCVRNILKETANDRVKDENSAVEAHILDLLKDLAELFEPESESNELSHETRDLVKKIVAQLVKNDSVPRYLDMSVSDQLPPEDSKSIEDDLSTTEMDESDPERPSLEEVLKHIRPKNKEIQDKSIDQLKQILKRLAQSQDDSSQDFIKDTLDNLVADILDPHASESVRDALATKIMNGARRVIAVYNTGDTKQVNDMVEDAIIYLLNQIAENVSKTRRSSFEDILEKIYPQGSSLERILLGPVKKALKALIVDEVENIHQLLKDSIEEPIRDIIPDKTQISRLSIKIGDRILITKEEIVAELPKETAEDKVIDCIRKLVKDIAKVIVSPKLPIIEDILQRLVPDGDEDGIEILNPVKGVLKKLIANGSVNIDDNVNNIVRDLLKDDISPAEASSNRIVNLLKPIQRDVGDKIQKCAQQITSDVLKDQTNNPEKLVKHRVQDLLKDLVDSVLPARNHPNRHNKQYPIPDGLVPNELLPVIHNIAGVLAQKGLKQDKDAIKQITDELLNKLLNHTTVKPQNQDDEDISTEETSDEQSTTTTTPEADHDSDSDVSSSNYSNEDTSEQPADSMGSEEPSDSNAESSDEHEHVPPVVVSPTGINGTYKVTLNINQLVDNEFKKLRNLHCECREGPLVNEKCPIHSVSKDDIKKAIQRNFFRKLIKAVPIEHAPSADDVIVDGITKFIENHETGGGEDESQPLEDDPLAQDLVQKVLYGITKISEKIENQELTEKESDDIIERIAEKIAGMNNAEKELLARIGDFLAARLDRPRHNGPRLHTFRRLAQNLVNRLKNQNRQHSHRPHDMFHRRKRVTFDFPPAIAEDLRQDDDCPTCRKIVRNRRDLYEKYLTKEPKTMLKKAERTAGKLNKFRKNQLRQIKFDVRSRRQAEPECGRCTSDSKFVNHGGNSTELGESTEKMARITRENYDRYFSASHENVKSEDVEEPLKVSLICD